MAAADDARIRRAVTFYAGFDEAVRADFGAGELTASTRFDHPTEKGQFVFEPGFDSMIFRIARDAGIHGGALEVTDVLPRRGRLFFPAERNIEFDRRGWGGTVSLWINTDPDTALKTPFCDPVQITERGSNDGGLWIDFPDTRPRALRMGAFPAAARGEQPMPESSPEAPLVWLKDVGFKMGEWHHLAITWENFDSDQKNAQATLYMDGRLVGNLQDREIAMRWNVAKTGLYVAVNFIGLLDEFSLFNRPLDSEEILRLNESPDILSALRRKEQ